METFKKLISSPHYWLALIFMFAAIAMLGSIPDESLGLKTWLAIFFLTKVCAIQFTVLSFRAARKLLEEWEEND